jgi:glycosyltransferase involved in cell wall biosynthesis
MAVQNGADYLERGMRTVLEQDFRDFEFVIVDDASTDRTAEMIHAARDSRVVYRRNERNIGQTASLNVALRLARGEYLARMDADDEWLPGKLSAQVRYLDSHQDAVVCGTSADWMDENGRITGRFRAPVEPKDVLFRLVSSTPLCHVSVLMRRTPVLAVGGYDEAYRYAADHKLWLDLARTHGASAIRNLPAVLTRYRVMSTSFGASTVLHQAGWEKTELICAAAREFCGLDVPPDDARAIYLRSHPGFGSEAERLVSHRRLTQIASAVHGRVPAKLRLELMLALVWSLIQAPATQPGRATSAVERFALAGGRALRRVRGAGLGRLKRMADRLLAGVGR